LKRSLLTMRRVIAPMRDTVNQFLRQERPIFTPGTFVYFSGVYDTSSAWWTRSTSHREMLTGTLEPISVSNQPPERRDEEADGAGNRESAVLASSSAVGDETGPRAAQRVAVGFWAVLQDQPPWHWWGFWWRGDSDGSEAELPRPVASVSVVTLRRGLRPGPHPRPLSQTPGRGGLFSPSLLGPPLPKLGEGPGVPTQWVDEGQRALKVLLVRRNKEALPRANGASPAAPSSPAKTSREAAPAARRWRRQGWRWKCWSRRRDRLIHPPAAGTAGLSLRAHRLLAVPTGRCDPWPRRT